MTKPDLGTKRICASCNVKFYDLHRTPIVCPTCETVFVLPKPAPTRPRRVIDPLPAPKIAEVADTALPDEKPDGETEPEVGVPMLELDEDDGSEPTISG